MTLAGFLLLFTLSFDHNFADWDALLKRYVTVTENGKVTRVDYTALKKKEAELDRVLVTLSRVSQQEFNKWTRNQQQAFLINAYNAFTWKRILLDWPVNSIKDAGGWRGPWKTAFFTLLDEERHLDWIEHEQLRPVYNDPRIHFAVNCASKGCPPLRGEAYRASDLDRQLEEQTRLFLSNTAENEVNVKLKTLRLSKIFDWFEDDFTQNNQSVGKWVSQYLPEMAKSSFKWKVTYTDYDWSLNGK
ncbi:MAG: DUF547 domain-containing protein [Bacteroidetes bacterium]|nr:DUF547 domain-containing protein [Bacteroidota bacterium]